MSDFPVSPTPSSLPWDLLDRYYADEATEEEANQVRAYLASSPERERVLEQVLGTVHRSAVDGQPADVPAMLAAAHERLAPAAILRRMVRTLFDGSVERAVAALLALDDAPLQEAELAQLRRLIDQAKREGR